MKARVIRGAGGGGERWVAPALAVGGGRPARELHEFAASGSAPAPSHEQAREAAFAQGLEEGRHAASEEAAARLALLGELIRQAQQPVQDLDDAVEEELAQLAMTIARQVIRRELKTDPGQVIAVVKEARTVLREVEGVVRISTHPDQAQLVRGMFSEDEALSGVRVEEDPTVSPGGCTVSTSVSFVDARVETRIAQVATQLLGDCREQGAPA